MSRFITYLVNVFTRIVNYITRIVKAFTHIVKDCMHIAKAFTRIVKTLTRIIHDCTRIVKPFTHVFSTSSLIVAMFYRVLNTHFHWHYRMILLSFHRLSFDLQLLINLWNLQTFLVTESTASPLSLLCTWFIYSPCDLMTYLTTQQYIIYLNYLYTH